MAAILRAFRAGRHEEAAALCNAALSAMPRHHGIRNALAVIWRGRGAFPEAMRSYLQAIALAPDMASYYANYANAISGRGAHVPALRLVRTALLIEPESLELRLMSGNILLRLGRADEALGIAESALESQRAAPRSHYLLGNCRRMAGDEVAALRSFRHVVALDPADDKARLNIAVLCDHRRERAVARRHYDAAIAAKPSSSSAHYNRALHLLSGGDLSAGWRDYEWRWRVPNLGSPQRRTIRPSWDGVARPGETLLVWPEQGVGDEILYASCVPDLLETGQEIILECDPRLVPLFRFSFPAARIRAKTQDDRGRELLERPDYHRHLPIGSLPRFFRRSLAGFPTRAAWLAAAPDAIRLWRQRIAALGPGLKVGVAWRSGVMSGDRARSYAPLAAWHRVFAIPGIRFVNLQYGVTNAERAILRELGIVPAEWPDLDLKDDFAGVAALITALDLVVTGPSATCMQAGALGRPVWVADGPPIYFQYHGTGRMPWVPSWRPFTRRDWSEPWDRVLCGIANALHARIGSIR